MLMCCAAWPAGRYLWPENAVAGGVCSVWSWISRVVGIFVLCLNARF